MFTSIATVIAITMGPGGPKDSFHQSDRHSCNAHFALSEPSVCHLILPRRLSLSSSKTVISCTHRDETIDTEEAQTSINSFFSQLPTSLNQLHHSYLYIYLLPSRGTMKSVSFSITALSLVAGSQACTSGLFGVGTWYVFGPCYLIRKLVERLTEYCFGSTDPPVTNGADANGAKMTAGAFSSLVTCFKNKFGDGPYEFDGG